MNIKNYYRRPRIITVIAEGMDTTVWNKFGKEYRGRVRGELLGRETATVHPVATWMSPRMKRSQSPLAVCFQYGTTRTRQRVLNRLYICIFINMPVWHLHCREMNLSVLQFCNVILWYNLRLHHRICPHGFPSQLIGNVCKAAVINRARLSGH